jgi:hypothetical protein
MRRSSQQSLFTSPGSSHGPTLIGAGLLLLLASTYCHGVPIVTAVALISLGATEVMIARPCAHARLVPITILHAATYATLYALFLGATLHASTATSTATRWPVTLDIAASLLPMLLAAKRICTHLFRTIESQT